MDAPGEVPLGNRAGDDHGLASEYELADPDEGDEVVGPEDIRNGLSAYSAAADHQLGRVVLA